MWSRIKEKIYNVIFPALLLIPLSMFLILDVIITWLERRDKEK
jgi:hypothetical protein